jgi:hypothetical protein
MLTISCEGLRPDFGWLVSTALPEGGGTFPLVLIFVVGSYVVVFGIRLWAIDCGSWSLGGLQ